MFLSSLITLVKSWLKPSIHEIFNSSYSGPLLVSGQGNSLHVSTGIWTQSGGLIRDLWQPVLASIHPSPHHNWLVLGLATGTVAKIISRSYQPKTIVGVEIDSQMLAIGRKYFGLDQIPNLHINRQNALHYLSSSPRADYILVDIYLQDRLPDFVYRPVFLSRLKKALTRGGTVIINHLYYSPQQKQQADTLVNSLSQYFTHIRLSRRLTNLLIICSH